MSLKVLLKWFGAPGRSSGRRNLSVINFFSMEEKIMKKLVLIMIVCVLAANGFAAWKYWDQQFGNDFEVGGNWADDIAPAAGDMIYIDGNGYHAVIDTAYYSADPGDASTILVGDWRSGNVLEVTTGGSLWACYNEPVNVTLGANGSNVHDPAGGAGELRVSGGFVAIGTDLVVGNNGTGVVNVSNDGVVHVQGGGIYLPLGSGSGTINLDNGDIYTNNVFFGTSGSGLVNITDGIMHIAGDKRGSAMFTDGSFLGYGSVDNLEVEFDGVWTNISAVPEPATMALLAMGGLGLLRKKS